MLKPPTTQPNPIPCRYPNLEAIGDLTQAEVNQIWDYQLKTGARSAKFGAWVSTIGYFPNFDACGSQTQSLQLTDAAPLGASGIISSAALTSEGLYKCVGP